MNRGTVGVKGFKIAEMLGRVARGWLLRLNGNFILELQLLCNVPTRFAVAFVSVRRWNQAIELARCIL